MHLYRDTGEQRDEQGNEELICMREKQRKVCQLAENKPRHLHMYTHTNTFINENNYVNTLSNTRFYVASLFTAIWVREVWAKR